MEVNGEGRIFKKNYGIVGEKKKWSFSLQIGSGTFTSKLPILWAMDNLKLDSHKNSP